MKRSSGDSSLPPSSHPHLNSASRERSQTLWKEDKPPYCALTELQTHSIHEHNKIIVLCHHICDGLSPSKDDWNTLLKSGKRLPRTPPCARAHAGHCGHADCDTVPTHLQEPDMWSDVLHHHVERWP